MHIGARVHNFIKERGITITWFASRLNTTRTNAYDIFARESIDTLLLWRISRILKYNFFKELSIEFEEIEEESNL